MPSRHSELVDIPAGVPRMGNAFSQWLGRKVLQIMGWSFEGQYPQDKKFVAAVAPHTSNWDFVVGMAAVFALRLKWSFLGKHSIFIWPFGGLLKKLGGIPIERSRSHGLVAQLCDRFAESDYMMLAMAPEGTRSKVEQWKSGFLQIANQANVPLLLIYFDFDRKVIGFGPCMPVSDDLQMEMQKVRTFYAKVPGKHPGKS